MLKVSFFLWSAATKKTTHLLSQESEWANASFTKLIIKLHEMQAARWMSGPRRANESEADVLPQRCSSHFNFFFWGVKLRP